MKLFQSTHIQGWSFQKVLNMNSDVNDIGRKTSCVFSLYAHRTIINHVCSFTYCHICVVRIIQKSMCIITTSINYVNVMDECLKTPFRLITLCVQMFVLDRWSKNIKFIITTAALVMPFTEGSENSTLKVPTRLWIIFRPSSFRIVLKEMSRTAKLCNWCPLGVVISWN